MKKMIFCLIVCILMSSLVFAQGSQEVQGPGAGAADPETRETGQSSGEGQDNETQGSGQGTPVNIETQQQNQGEETKIQNTVQTQVKTGSYTTESGKQVQVQEQSNNKVQLKSGQISAETSMEMTQGQVDGKTRLSVKLSNGQNSEVKIMPDTASERALERLRINVCSEENNCQIELKEVGQGEEVRAAYEVQVQKQAKLFGLFKTQMQVQAQVDAENGEVIQTKKPWWAFLASESEE